MNLLISDNGAYSLGKVQGKNFYDLVATKACTIQLELKFGTNWVPLTLNNQNSSILQAPFCGKIPVLSGAEEARITVSNFTENFRLFFDASQSGSMEGLIFSNFASNLTDTNSRFKVEILGTPAVSRQIAAGENSSNTVLTSTCRRISIKAVGADIRYSIGVSPQSASSISHFIADGERLDFAILPNSKIGIIRAGETDGTLEVSELI